MSEINAIATNNYILHNIDAKKLYVQEPLFTANSGDAVYVGWRPDETVLWDGSGTAASSCILSEHPTNFNQICIYAGETNYISNFYFPSNTTNIRIIAGAGGSNTWLDFFFIQRNDLTLTVSQDKRLNFGGTTSTANTYSVSIGDKNVLYKVVGINRISGGNA